MNEYYNESPNRNKSKLITVVFVAIAVLAATNIMTYILTKNLASSQGLNIKTDDTVAREYINKMLFIRDQINKEFLWDVKEEDLWVGATKGLIAGTGDMYSSYMTNEEYEKYTSSSKFDGIGVQLMSDETMIEITKVFSNSPAHTAGLHIGDQLLAADNISLVGQNTEFATSIIRGERGTSVKLEVFRPEDGTSHVFDITRDTIVTEYVSSKIVDDDIGYIYLSEFGKDSAKDFENKLEDLKNQNVKGFILDLRQNPGGNVFDAIKISDALLPQTEIFYTLDKNSKKDLNFSDASYWDIPMVVLVDAGSASASEIVSGTLQDNKRAVVVGTKSYGKGVIQFLRPLSDGSVYKLTYQEYYFPSGKKIHGEGITPDYVVTQNEDYTNTLVDLIPEQEDSQLQKAIELLKK